MPFVEVNNCQMYYESLGPEQPGKAPIILIHGSTQTGSSCWQLAAPLLARQYHVIVPDCRGHGQSRNPEITYAFKELAADVAGLVKALGHPRAHIIGHSNGGNIALVTLIEHPDIVQSAILQAANAYVSPDLLEREPAIFDPDRVAREAPAWMNEMIALHGAANDENYWRDLLRMTVKEIISEPNYAPSDLAKVSRPTFVIQGQKDSVNAPSRHAQFIAMNIPYAELWLPENAGHSVHEEILFIWVERVLEFLHRRGDEFNNALYCLKQDRYSDDRETVFQPYAEMRTPVESPPRVTLTGKVLTVEQSQTAIKHLSQETMALIKNELDVLSVNSTWAVVNRPVNDLRRDPKNQAECVSQALLDEVVQILETRGEWAWVRMEQDGYLGWIHLSALQVTSYSDLKDFRESINARVLAELLPAQLLSQQPVGQAKLAVLIGKLPFGVAVVVEEWRGDTAVIRLPDGAKWLVASDGLLADTASPRPDESGISFTLQLIRRFIGVPYMWGGRTPFGFDCSGLAQTFLCFLGMRVPRDADQQFQTGAPVEDTPQPGDLLFFGEADEQSSQRFANITHVAISLGGTEFIHANGAAWGVSYNSFNPSSLRYRAWLHDHLVGIRRFR
jgi:gamma-D-glutamyl-L-lysine dipeptidyl-peptidase